MIEKILAWVKGNYILAAVIGLVLVFMFFGRQVKRMFAPRRIRHRRPVVHRAARARRSMPRSVNMPRTKSGKVKKAWQIKGSDAARRHMAKIRRMR